MVRKEVLANGLTVLTETMSDVRSVAVGIWLKRGSRHEASQDSGLSHFIEHMVFKGTERRSQVQIAQELDAIGGQSDAFTTKEYASFHAKVLDEHLPVVMDLLSDIVLNPSFDPEELERERNVILEEIKMVEDTYDDLAHEMFTESFWPDHPLGRSILGTHESVGRFGRQDLQRFFREAYTPQNLVIAAAGHLEHGHFVELIHRHFDALEHRVSAIDESPPRVQTTIRCREKDIEQAHLVMGTIAPHQSHDSRYAGYVLNALLGGTMSSRLFQVIREERGLAYNVFSNMTSYRDAGCLTVYAGTSPENVTQVIDLIMDELRKIKTNPVEDQELRRTKDHLKGNILLGLEGSGSRMSQLARHEMVFGRHIPPSEILDKVEGVTREDVLNLAAELIEGRALAFTAVGKLSQLGKLDETLVA
jgi:predicted Zn-dependent peptidase